VVGVVGVVPFDVAPKCVKGATWFHYLSAEDLFESMYHPVEYCMG
jgi:hypothetical protein